MPGDGIQYFADKLVHGFVVPGAEGFALPIGHHHAYANAPVTEGVAQGIECGTLHFVVLYAQTIQRKAGKVIIEVRSGNGQSQGPPLWTEKAVGCEGKAAFAEVLKSVEKL